MNLNKNPSYYLYLLTLPRNGTRWCSHKENISMSLTTTISSWSSSKIASLSTSEILQIKKKYLWENLNLTKHFVNSCFRGRVKGWEEGLGKGRYSIFRDTGARIMREVLLTKGYQVTSCMEEDMGWGHVSKLVVASGWSHYYIISKFGSLSDKFVKKYCCPLKITSFFVNMGGWVTEQNVCKVFGWQAMSKGKPFNLASTLFFK